MRTLQGNRGCNSLSFSSGGTLKERTVARGHGDPKATASLLRNVRTPLTRVCSVAALVPAPNICALPEVFLQATGHDGCRFRQTVRPLPRLCGVAVPVEAFPEPLRFVQCCESKTVNRLHNTKKHKRAALCSAHWLPTGGRPLPTCTMCGPILRRGTGKVYPAIRTLMTSKTPMRPRCHRRRAI